MINIEQLIDEVKRLATEYPSNVYSGPDGKMCSYSEGLNSECPLTGCIFGIAFSNLGFPIHEVNNNTGIFDILVGLGIKASPDQRDWCVAVQSFQDSKLNWAHAVKSASEKISI